MNALAATLITGMFHDNLAQAAAMMRIRNFGMARAELQNALNKLDQLEALTPISPINPIGPIPGSHQLPPIDI